MGQMTKSTLLHIYSGGGGSAGFGEAKTYANNTLAAIEGPVWEPIKKGQIWSGVGQPDAESVLHTNVLALNTSRALMEAGEAAMGAATHAFSALQVNMEDLNTYAKSLGCWVNEDGTVVWDDNNPNKPTTLYEEDINKQVNVQLAIQQTLKTATLLDQSTKASLQVIYDNAPDIVENATDAAKALPKNKQTLVEALDSRQLILEVSAGWLIVDSTVLGVGDVKVAGGNPLPDSVAEQISELDKIIQGAIGKTKASPLLTVLKADLQGIVLTGILQKAEAGAQGAAAAGKEAVEKLLKAPGRLLGIVGWAQFAGDLAVFLAGKLAPDAYPDSHPVVTSNGDVKAHVNDFELSHIASGYYFTHGYGGGEYPDASLADLARAQKLGAVEPGQFDYVQEATELRSQLQQWLAENGDLTADRLYAQGLVEELDAALEPPVAEEEPT